MVHVIEEASSPVVEVEKEFALKQTIVVKYICLSPKIKTLANSH